MSNIFAEHVQVYVLFIEYSYALGVLYMSSIVDVNKLAVFYALGLATCTYLFHFVPFFTICLGHVVIPSHACMCFKTVVFTPVRLLLQVFFLKTVLCSIPVTLSFVILPHPVLCVYQLFTICTFELSACILCMCQDICSCMPVLHQFTFTEANKLYYKQWWENLGLALSILVFEMAGTEVISLRPL